MSTLNTEPVDLGPAGTSTAIAPATPPPVPNPPPPAPEPPKPDPAAPPVEGKDDPEKWPRNAKDWDAFKAKRKEREDALTKERDGIKAELESSRKEFDALKKQGPSPELEALKKERDELSDRLRIADVENHPKFKTYFDNKTNAQVDLAKRLVGTDRAARMEELLKMPDGAYKDQQLEEFVSDLSAVKQSQIGSVLTNLENIRQEKEREIGHARENRDRISAEAKLTQENSAKERVATLNKAFEDGVNRVTDKTNGLFMYQKRDGDDEGSKVWNAGVDERVAKAKSVMFGQNPPEFIVNTILSSVATPALLQEITSNRKEIESLQAQVKSLSAAGPKVPSGGGTKPADSAIPPAGAKPGSSPSEAIRGWAGDMIKSINQP